MQIVRHEDSQPASPTLRWWHWALIGLLIGGIVFASIVGPERQPLLSHGYPPLPTMSSQADIVIDHALWDRMPTPIAENLRACPNNAAALPAMDKSGSYNLSDLKVCLHGLWEFTMTDGKTINPVHPDVPASMSLKPITLASGQGQFMTSYNLGDDYKLFAVLLRDDTAIGGGLWWYNVEADFLVDPTHHYTFMIAAYLPDHMDNASHFQENVDWAALMQQAAMMSPEK